MPILAEYGLVPDVFDSTCYTSADLCCVHLQHLKEALLSDGLVRDLHDGDWLRIFEQDGRAWHLRGKELLRKLATQNRLRTYPACGAAPPADDVGWCNEAIESHTRLNLQGIVTTDATFGHFHKNVLVAPITRLSSAAWWRARSPSVRLRRNLTDYQAHLGLVLACANSVMLIDAHLDPSQVRYAQAVDLICAMAWRNPGPLIEIHRVCYVGSGEQRQIIEQSEWQRRFTQAFAARLQAAGLRIEVFIWDDFHDRYIISDLVGIHLGNGLDTTTSTAKTTWDRLGRDDRDDVQREFDPASGQHGLRGRFSIP
jgi:hypothetical protein